MCGESYQCKYDYSTSLNMEFALFTKYYQDQFINIREGVLKPEARGNKYQGALNNTRRRRKTISISIKLFFINCSGILRNFVNARKR